MWLCYIIDYCKNQGHDEKEFVEDKHSKSEFTTTITEKPDAMVCDSQSLVDLNFKEFTVVKSFLKLNLILLFFLIFWQRFTFT
jgi:hypothetical protein